MMTTPPISHWGLLIGLAFLHGLAFEEHYASGLQRRPGGVRTFPLLALSGGVLWLLDPARLLPFTAGLIVLGVWLHGYYRTRMAIRQADGEAEGSLIINISNLLAYLAGPVALAGPPWLAIGLTVCGVGLLSARQKLHDWAARLPAGEIITLGKFLILAGIVLPLLPNQPLTPFTAITPHQVWLAVVVVSSLSYASYLLQRYVSQRRGLLMAAVLGGLYSSTAATVMFARHTRNNPGIATEAQAGTVLATALMYPRLIAIVAVFNVALAWRMAEPMSLLGAAALALSLIIYSRASRAAAAPAMAGHANPLELGSALIFAALFVIVSVASAWVKTHFGHVGLYWLALVVGITDIAPFVLSIAQGGVHALDPAVACAAVLIAASSNNLLKVAYAAAFTRSRRCLPSTLAMAALAVAGVVLALRLAP